MAQRDKRSISLPPDVARAIDAAAEASGKTMSGWIVEAAEHRLRIEEGQRAVEEWEAEHGPLSAGERSAGHARVLELLALNGTAAREAS